MGPFKNLGDIWSEVACLEEGTGGLQVVAEMGKKFDGSLGNLLRSEAVQVGEASILVRLGLQKFKKTRRKWVQKR